LRILVFIKEVPDIAVPLEQNAHSGRLRMDEPVRLLNPPDCAALELSLRVKETHTETHITLVQLGPPSGERWIREGLALGCDEGFRIWGEGLDDVRPQGKALVFARAAELLDFDLILVGNRSQDTTSAQVGILMACHLNLPHISSVMELEVEREEETVIATRSLARGYQERIRCPLPLVASTDVHLDIESYASLPALLGAMDREVPCWDLAQMGIPIEHVREADSLLTYGPLRPPRPRPRFIPLPDSSLPAFERISTLLKGTIQRREGRVIREDEDRVVDELFHTLLREGWLDHLREQR
jgi:electron transfer flavoprotein beta subunit